MGFRGGGGQLDPPQHILVFKYPSRARVNLWIYIYNNFLFSFNHYLLHTIFFLCAEFTVSLCALRIFCVYILCEVHVFRPTFFLCEVHVFRPTVFLCEVHVFRPSVFLCEVHVFPPIVFLLSYWGFKYIEQFIKNIS